MSYRAHLLSWAFEHHLKPRLGSHLDVVQARRIYDAIPVPMPRGVQIADDTVAGVPGEWIRPVSTHPQQLRLVYIHGGGFVCCSARTHRSVTGAFAQLGFDVFAPNYRLAPENHFPCALDDLLQVWKAVSAEGPTCIAGDSAGANLALALLLRARDEGLIMPSAAALFSPPTDFLGTGLSISANAHLDALMDVEALKELIPAYLGTADPGQPLVSPLYADLEGLPPLLIHVGEREVLRDDSIRFADKARIAGVEVELSVYPIVPHAWQLATPLLPEAQHSIAAAAKFLRDHATVECAACL